MREKVGKNRRKKSSRSPSEQNVRRTTQRSQACQPGRPISRGRIRFAPAHVVPRSFVERQGSTAAGRSSGSGLLSPAFPRIEPQWPRQAKDATVPYSGASASEWEKTPSPTSLRDRQAPKARIPPPRSGPNYLGKADACSAWHTITGFERFKTNDMRNKKGSRKISRADGVEGARTPNPRVANAVLSQLSYDPGRAGRYWQPAK